MFLHAILERAAVAFLSLVLLNLFITGFTSCKCSLGFLRYDIIPYRFILSIAFILSRDLIMVTNLSHIGLGCI